MRGLAKTLALIVAAAGLASGALAQSVDRAHAPIKTTRLADNLYLLESPGFNMVVLSGPDGVLTVDSLFPETHDAVMAAIRKFNSGPVRYVINTHLHSDHTGGNGAMAREGAIVIAHDNVLKRMQMPKTERGGGAYPRADWPSVTYSQSMTLHFDGEEIYVFHPPPAHTDGDSIVWFKHANVMHVGDLPASLRYNNIGVDDGGTIDGMIADGKLVLSMANAQTRIVPGHLGVVGVKEVREQEVMFQAVRDRVAKLVREGKTEAEVVAAKPTKDFDAGRLGGGYTPDQFVRLVYTDLSRRLKK